MIRIIIDAFAWIEYLNGSAIGQKVRDYLLKHDCFTCAVTIAETVSKVKRLDMNEKRVIEAIEAYSKIIPMTHELSIEAGLFHAEQRKKKTQFSLSDAYVYVTAKHIKAKILTNDHHFKDFKETIFLKK